MGNYILTYLILYFLLSSCLIKQINSLGFPKHLTNDYPSLCMWYVAVILCAVAFIVVAFIVVVFIVVAIVKIELVNILNIF